MRLVGAAKFVPAIEYMRTEAERRDQVLSFRRSDERFFASGACHILAFRFLARHPDDGFNAVCIAPSRGLPGSHVYATDGTWGFDFNGWTREEQLLRHTTAACRERWPDWDFERILLQDPLDDFPYEDYKLRRPEQFALNPLPRADAYLDRFPMKPPRPE